MKKSLIIFLSALALSVSAQDVGQDYSIIVADVDIMKLEGVEYIELVGAQKLMSSEVNVFVDYGQKTQLFGKVQTIRDDSKGTFANGTGMNKDFKSMIDALNFFNSRGWEYVNQYVACHEHRFFYGLGGLGPYGLVGRTLCRLRVFAYHCRSTLTTPANLAKTGKARTTASNSYVF
jgi:hypothetical protein